MKSRPHKVYIRDPQGDGALEVECEESDELGRLVHFEATAFDGCSITSVSDLRSLARALEHAADWISEDPTLGGEGVEDE